MYCIHCGASMPDEAKYCSTCGKSQSTKPGQEGAQVVQANLSNNGQPQYEYCEIVFESKMGLYLSRVAFGPKRQVPAGYTRLR